MRTDHIRAVPGRLGVYFMSSGAGHRPSEIVYDRADSAFALRAGDAKAINNVLGPGGDEIVSSGDTVQDENTRKQVIEAYDRKHSITKGADGQTFLSFGSVGCPQVNTAALGDSIERLAKVCGSLPARSPLLRRRNPVLVREVFVLVIATAALVIGFGLTRGMRWA